MKVMQVHTLNNCGIQLEGSAALPFTLPPGA